MIQAITRQGRFRAQTSQRRTLWGFVPGSPVWQREWAQLSWVHYRNALQVFLITKYPDRAAPWGLHSTHGLSKPVIPTDAKRIERSGGPLCSREAPQADQSAFFLARQCLVFPEMWATRRLASRNSCHVAAVKR